MKHEMANLENLRAVGFQRRHCLCLPSGEFAGCLASRAAANLGASRRRELPATDIDRTRVETTALVNRETVQEFRQEDNRPPARSRGRCNPVCGLPSGDPSRCRSPAVHHRFRQSRSTSACQYVAPCDCSGEGSRAGSMVPPAAAQHRWHA